MCDTFVALPGHTKDGSLVFGKNSDREPNEAQALEYHPPRDHPAGSEVRCTHVAIPQVRHTHGVLLCRPHWMWGAEMGANEHGVVIGNEAVFTRVERSLAPGLLGMDLLRLALERTRSAREALSLVTELLARHGQGGRHGGRLDYHSSFVLADREEAWVLETAGELWAAVRVARFAAISNGLTIGEEIDLLHPGLPDAARRLGLLRRGETLDFARCFSDRLYTTLSACRARRRRTLERLSERAGVLGVEDALSILRDHGEDGPAYRPDRHLLMRHVCAHAANPLTRGSAQSTASLVAHLGGRRPTLWATGTSAPCTSVFKPIRLEGAVLPSLGPSPGPTFDEQSAWWRHELVHRRALHDLPRALALLVPERDALEHEFLARARETDGRGASAFTLTQEAFRRARELDEALLPRLEGEVAPWARWPPYRSYWRRRNEEVRVGVAS
jgi:dipeptidase